MVRKGLDQFLVRQPPQFDALVIGGGEEVITGAVQVDGADG